jgi:DNA polymerase-3 subunit beta
MNITVDRSELADAVAFCARHLGRMSSLQTLSGIHLEATPDGLTLRSTDYDVFARASVVASGLDAVAGVALAPGRFLSEIVKVLDAPTVTLSFDGTRLTITNGTATFSMPTMPAEDFPAMAELPAAVGSLPVATLAHAVAQVAVAAAKEEATIMAKPGLSAVLIEPGATLTLVASDTYRLPVREVEWTAETDTDTEPVLWPAATLADAVRFLGDGTATLHAGMGPHGSMAVGLSTPSRALSSRVVDGQFAPYRKLMPAGALPFELEVERERLSAVVRRAALAGDAKTKAPVLLAVTEGVMVVSCGTQEHARDEVMAAYDGPDFQVAFNPTYLREALACFTSERVTFGFGNDAGEPAVRRPALITGKDDDGYRHLLMPVRLQS